MKLLLTERGQIVAINSSIEYGVWGNHGTVASWRIGKMSYMMDDSFSVVEVPDAHILTYVREYEYYYIDGEFKLADECPNEYRDRITALEALTLEQKLQLQQADDTAIELYEMQMAQEEINQAQDDALIEIWEMIEMGGGE